LLLHGEDVTFIETREAPQTRQEEEANEYAAAALIPAEHLGTLLELTPEFREVIGFARSIGVSPGIVVGQLQYRRRLKFNQLNSLKRRFKWADSDDHPRKRT
jgi:HTH-type transcriptional regulator / antitoxin HigA